jgi:hypothetical protein
LSRSSGQIRDGNERRLDKILKLALSGAGLKG